MTTEFYTHAYNGRGEGMETYIEYVPTMEGIRDALVARASLGRQAWLLDAARAIGRDMRARGMAALAAAAQAFGAALLPACKKAARDHVKLTLIGEFGEEDGVRVYNAHIEFSTEVSARLVHELCGDRALRRVLQRYLASSDVNPGWSRWGWACGNDGRARRLSQGYTWPRWEAVLAVCQVVDPSL